MLRKLHTNPSKIFFGLPKQNLEENLYRICLGHQHGNQLFLPNHIVRYNQQKSTQFEKVLKLFSFSMKVLILNKTANLN